jgi:secondary thiamine-phosphate synthase enzyme
MQTCRREYTLETRGDGDVLDLTARAQQAIDESGLRDGVCTVFVAHSTCGVTTIEYEPGCTRDLNDVLEAITPRGRRWEHNVRNADTNGHSHVRAALVGPSLTVPFSGSRLDVGTWQRIVCIDFDDRPRSRRVIVQVLGV